MADKCDLERELAVLGGWDDARNALMSADLLQKFGKCADPGTPEYQARVEERTVLEQDLGMTPLLGPDTFVGPKLPTPHR